jgi:hypothetical protein
MRGCYVWLETGTVDTIWIRSTSCFMIRSVITVSVCHVKPSLPCDLHRGIYIIDGPMMHTGSRLLAAWKKMNGTAVFGCIFILPVIFFETSVSSSERRGTPSICNTVPIGVVGTTPLRKNWISSKDAPKQEGMLELRKLSPGLLLGAPQLVASSSESGQQQRCLLTLVVRHSFVMRNTPYRIWCSRGKLKMFVLLSAREIR